ncbi:hypothetical protein CKW46_05275 [Mycobacterium liflandii]|nr:hypothetical protein CKW46_05275 [Mycobacterium liflandii]
MSDHAEDTEISTALHRQTYTASMTNVGSPVHHRIAVEDIANTIARRAPALLISRLVSCVDDLWCRAIGAGV